MTRATSDWWETFFDDTYLQLWGGMLTPERTAREAEGAWTLLGLAPGARVLDAPCGYGRLSRALADRGARVTGVDLSAAMLARAEQTRGPHDTTALRYLRHDLRTPLAGMGGGFDAALNVFSSLGYGADADDEAVLRALAAALRPGGKLLLETMHRDAVAALHAREVKPAMRFPDGTLVVEEPALDALTGRVETCWYWSGPHGAGQKAASLRMYTASELAALLGRTGFSLRGAFAGLSSEPFRAAGPSMGGRLALVAERI